MGGITDSVFWIMIAIRIADYIIIHSAFDAGPGDDNVGHPLELLELGRTFADLQGGTALG